MTQTVFRAILDTFNATSADIRASVVMTKDGLALASASPRHPGPGYDEDKISALSASIIRLGHKLMGDCVGGELEQVIIKGREGAILAVHDEDLALAVLACPEAEADLLFPRMDRAVESLRHLLRESA